VSRVKTRKIRLDFTRKTIRHPLATADGMETMQRKVWSLTAHLTFLKKSTFALSGKVRLFWIKPLIDKVSLARLFVAGTLIQL